MPKIPEQVKPVSPDPSSEVQTGGSAAETQIIPEQEFVAEVANARVEVASVDDPAFDNPNFRHAVALADKDLAAKQVADDYEQRLEDAHQAELHIAAEAEIENAKLAEPTDLEVLALTEDEAKAQNLFLRWQDLKRATDPAFTGKVFTEAESIQQKES